jgi:beta-lactamase superfamily II metal-dependent hydrolase
MVKIHFLNVGHGDCSVIEHANGNLTMIDINNGSELTEDDAKPILESLASSRMDYLGKVMAGQNGWRTWPELLAEAGYDIELTNPVEFFKNEFPGKSIFRYIQTHPDFDHMRGLAALHEEGISITNFWDTQHTKSPNPEETADEDMAEWAEYQRLRKGDACTVLHLNRGAKGVYYNQNPAGVDGGNGLYILSPTPELTKEFDKDGKRNELSYVIQYRYAGRTVIFGGDAEQGAWQSIYDCYGQNLKCDVLKASHHGRDTGYHQEAVKAMSPSYTIVSVGKKPETDATNKYRQYSDEVWSTRWFGSMTLQIDAEGTISWVAEKVRNEN